MGETRSLRIIVRVVATGICHTDAHIRSQGYETPLPSILGHEGAGIVESVGSDVTSVAPGDHVIMSFPSCGRCHHCLAGHPAYCDHNLRLSFGGARLDGSNAYHGVHGHSSPPSPPTRSRTSATPSRWPTTFHWSFSVLWVADSRRAQAPCSTRSGCGDVVELGPGVDAVRVGDRVWTTMQGLGGVRAERDGGYAEFVTVAASAVPPLHPGGGLGVGLAVPRGS